MLLLDRAHRDLGTGMMTRETLIEQITTVRRSLSILADHLLYLAEDRLWEELVAEQSQHRSAEALLGKANSLVQAAGERFPELLSSGTGRRLVDEALRYFNAVNAFYSRLLAQASASRDFSMLSPEQYVSAALTRSRGELAVPLARAVFDPASILLFAERLLSAVAKYRPAPPRRRPPRPPDSASNGDPVTEAREREQTKRVVMEAEMELHLQGVDEVDLTSRIRAARWRGAARIVTNALLASADPGIPVAADLSDALIVAPDGPGAGRPWLLPRAGLPDHHGGRAAVDHAGTNPNGHRRAERRIHHWRCRTALGGRRDRPGRRDMDADAVHRRTRRGPDRRLAAARRPDRGRTR